MIKFNQNIPICPYCQNEMTVPDLDNKIQSLYLCANHKYPVYVRSYEDNEMYLYFYLGSQSPGKENKYLISQNISDNNLPSLFYPIPKEIILTRDFLNDSYQNILDKISLYITFQ